MRFLNRSHASLNKLVVENEDLSSSTGTYNTGRLYKLIVRKKWPIIFGSFLVLSFTGLCFVLWVSYLSSTRYAAHVCLDYYPKQSAQVSHMDSNQLLQLFSPRIILPTIPEETKKKLEIDESIVTFEKDSNQATRFIVSALGKTEEQASARANAYADAVVKLYIGARQRDLESWKQSTLAEEERIFEKFKALDNAEQLINRSNNITSLDEEIERVSQLKLQNELEFTKIDKQCTQFSKKLEKMEAQIGSIPTHLLEDAAELYDYKLLIDETTKQLSLLAKEGKSDTPQCMETKSKLADLQATFQNFCGEVENTTKLSQEALLKLGAQFHQIQEARKEFEDLQKKREEARFNQEATTEKMESLHNLIPKYKDIHEQRLQFEQERATHEEFKSSLTFLATAAEKELEKSDAQTRKTHSALISIQKSLLCFFFAAIIAGVLGVLLVHIEADTGKILSLKELTFQPGLAVIGTVGGEHDKAEQLYFRFKTAMGRRKTVYVGPMPGARCDVNISKEFAIQCALCGQKLLIIEMVDAMTFEPPEDANIFAAVSYKGDRGWMPLADMSCLSSSELLLLEADLKMLSSDFDVVMLVKKSPFTGEGVFAAQVTQLCDATLLLFGKNATPRKLLRDYFNNEKDEGRDGVPNLHRKPVMGVLTISQ